MKLTLKLITTAVALAVSGSAFAVTGDIAVDVYDPISGQSIIMDTGVALLTAPPASTTTIQVGTQYAANWATFSSILTGEGQSLANLVYTAIAGTGTAASGTVELSYSSVPASGVNGPTLLADAVSVGGFVPTPLGSMLPGIIGSSAYFGLVGVAGTYGGNAGVGGVVSALTGTTMGLYLGTNTRTSGTILNQSPVADITFNGTSITIAAATAAVPEPGSFALMGAGLLAIGALVRRRTRG